MLPQLATQVKYVLPVLHERCSAIFQPKHPKWLPINFRSSEKVGPKCGTTSVKLNNDLDEAKTTISKSFFLQHVLYMLIFSLVLILSRLLKTKAKDSAMSKV